MISYQNLREFQTIEGLLLTETNETVKIAFVKKSEAINSSRMFLLPVILKCCVMSNCAGTMR
jgi:hypothetical protein